MSATVETAQGPISLGDVISFYRAIDEVKARYGAEWLRRFPALAGVVNASEHSQEVDPGWLSDVREQAATAAAELTGLSRRAAWVLDTLAEGPALNFDPDQARDEHGRWAPSSGARTGLTADERRNLNDEEKRAFRDVNTRMHGKTGAELKALHAEKADLHDRIRKRLAGGGVDEEAPRGGGGHAVSSAYISDRLARAKQEGRGLLKEVQSIMDLHSEPAGDRAEHGMSDKERMRGFSVDGVAYMWSKGAEHAAKNTLISEFTKEPIDRALRGATKEVLFCSQENSQDGYWRAMRPGFMQSAATGGDGKVVVYKHPLERGLLAHEMGHNLAAAEWGSTEPPYGSGFYNAQLKEPAVSGYAAHTRGEDFAETARLYTNDRERFRAKFPLKFEAFENVLGRHYGY